jgi:hypothetical protein
VTIFGGGEAEGTSAVVQVAPGAPREVGSLPRPLSDAVAAKIGGADYIAGGWDGSTLNTRIYRYVPGRAPEVAGKLPGGVRYPAVGAVGGKLLIAGGEAASGAATSAIRSFDPATGRTSRVGRLPFPLAHAAGAALDGRFYVLGGMRGGSPVATILSWAPGSARARRAGALREPLSDLTAVTANGVIVVAGGEGSIGPVDTVTALRPKAAH